MKMRLNELRKVDSDSGSMPSLNVTLLATSASANDTAAAMPGLRSASQLDAAVEFDAVMLGLVEPLTRPRWGR